MIQLGADVQLRGRAPYGYLKAVNERGWAEVDWKSDPPGPRICHVKELEWRVATRPADVVNCSELPLQKKE